MIPLGWSRIDSWSAILVQVLTCSVRADLDFLDTVKLVNYIRTQVKGGNMNPTVSSKEAFNDEAYLKPVLEDDAVLYSIDELDLDGEQDGSAPDRGSTAAEQQVLELQEELERLRNQFSEYRLAVQQSMEEQLSKEDEKLGSASVAKSSSSKLASRLEEMDADYFTSYAYNGKSTPTSDQAFLSFSDERLRLSDSRVYVERCRSHRCLP